jgi:hypothetical protein
MKRMKSLIVLLVLSAATACVPIPPPGEGAVFVEFGPPPPRYEEVPVQPGPEFVWVRGFWAWEGGQYAWRPGHWAARPQPRAHWVEGRWYRAHGRGRGNGGGWYFVEGHWEN